MNKNVKKVVLAGMITSMLFSMECEAKELGDVKVSGSSFYPVASGIRAYGLGHTTSDEEDFLNDLFGDVYEKEPSEEIGENVKAEEVVEEIDEKIEIDNNNESYNEADKSVISYFQDAKEKLKEYAESEDYNNLKRKGKDIVVQGIDFLFYDGTIKGFTRKQLTEEGKKDVINTIEGTVEFLDEYFPGFSDTFGEKYTKAKEYLKEKYVKVLDKVKGWLGEENYSTIGEEFSNIGQDFGDIFDILGNILDEKYQQWKLK